MRNLKVCLHEEIRKIQVCKYFQLKKNALSGAVEVFSDEREWILRKGT